MDRRVRCLCGETELLLRGEPLVELYCHCVGCQKAHGAAFTPAAMYRAADVELVRGAPLYFKVTKKKRWACPGCGTRLLCEGSERAWGINATLEGYGAFDAKMHINCESAVCPLADDLPHYKTVPEAFGGSDEVVTW